MSPAQRRKRFASLKAKGKKSKGFGLIALVIILLLALAFVAFNTKYWRAEAKVVLVQPSLGGEILVTAFDPETEEITNIIVPANTELEVARELGRWKAKSIWKLGENEKLSGKLLKETVIKNFHFPVIAWADSKAYGFATGDVLALAKAVFFPYKTNLRIGDRIRIGLFSLGVKTGKRIEINLSETSYLKKTKLTDGEEGFTVTGKTPRELLILFADAKVSQKGLRVNIKDATGKYAVAQETGETIEVMGAKVAAVTKMEKENSDCKISGKDKSFTRLVGEVFDCKEIGDSPEGTFDLEITLGETFAKRF